MYVAATIPEDVLERLRAGARQALLAPIMQPTGETWPGEPCRRFRDAAALLDAIGWEAEEGWPEIVIDVKEHARALQEALTYALNSALAELRVAQGRVPTRTSAACSGLVRLDAIVDAGRPVLSSNPRMRCLHPKADALLVELDRRRATCGQAWSCGEPDACRRSRSAGGRAPLRGRLLDLPSLRQCARRLARAGVQCRTDQTR